MVHTTDGKRFFMLKENGLSCWNVMNFGKQNLVETVFETHEKNHYQLIDTVGF